MINKLISCQFFFLVYKINIHFDNRFFHAFRFKDDRNCSRRIAEVLDPDGKISPAQISNKLKKLGLTIASRKKKGDDETFSTSPNQKRKRVSAFNEDQEALIKVLYEQ
jgi:timeless